MAARSSKDFARCFRAVSTDSLKTRFSGGRLARGARVVFAREQALSLAPVQLGLVEAFPVLFDGLHGLVEAVQAGVHLSALLLHLGHQRQKIRTQQL